jgi:hypothetical protein
MVDEDNWKLLDKQGQQACLNGAASTQHTSLKDWNPVLGTENRAQSESVLMLSI